MKLKILILLLTVNCFINSMESSGKNSNLKQFLIETPTLLFLSAWNAINGNKPLGLVGEPTILELENKIKSVNQCVSCSDLEKKFFINLINNKDLDNDSIKNYFGDLISKYLQNKKFENKNQLLDSMLLRACAIGNDLLVNVLIDLGADVNSKDEFGATALMLATNRNHKNVVQRLIDAKADVNERNIIDRTALMFASLKGNADIVKILINSNAVVDLKDDFGKTALSLAKKKNRQEIVEILEKAIAYGS